MGERRKQEAVSTEEMGEIAEGMEPVDVGENELPNDPTKWREF